MRLLGHRTQKTFKESLTNERTLRHSKRVVTCLSVRLFFFFFLNLVSNTTENGDSSGETRHLAGFLVCKKTPQGSPGVETTDI